ncbi:MAG: metalloregulator ArsR/SmtB family transcription factor [archaeon]|jgi:ArsR family transcriptional regulator
MVDEVNGYLLFKALGDQTRFKIVSILLGGEKCACVIPELVGRAQPTVSLQLKYLVEVGILSSRKDGKKILYKIADKRIAKIIKLSKKGLKK